MNRKGLGKVYSPLAAPAEMRRVLPREGFTHPQTTGPSQDVWERKAEEDWEDQADLIGLFEQPDGTATMRPGLPNNGCPRGRPEITQDNFAIQEPTAASKAEPVRGRPGTHAGP